MVVKCETCCWQFDDEFRSYVCPHYTFPANDGNNIFKHHRDSTLVCPHDIRGGVDCSICDPEMDT